LGTDVWLYETKLNPRLIFEKEMLSSGVNQIFVVAGRAILKGKGGFYGAHQS